VDASQNIGRSLTLMLFHSMTNGDTWHCLTLSGCQKEFERRCDGPVDGSWTGLTVFGRGGR
jgi:hypothetical protein